MPAEVDPEKCEGCNDCVPICPQGCISLEECKARINREECIDCNACIDVCTKNAIKME